MKLRVSQHSFHHEDNPQIKAVDEGNYLFYRETPRPCLDRDFERRYPPIQEMCDSRAVSCRRRHQYGVL